MAITDPNKNGINFFSHLDTPYEDNATCFSTIMLSHILMSV